MLLLEILKKFLSKNLKSSAPVLLAYSGGVDSSCLFDLLMKYKENFQLDLHVVHINHGWRKESDIEEKIIKEKMAKLKITFHYKKFALDKTKNLENESRIQRLKFFNELYKKFNYQALIFAHQKDDLAETVLKRLLEGANLYSLTSMQEVAKFQDMIVWRPLLQVSRKDIFEYNDVNKIEYFLDKTNEDTKYLRAKMRKDIFPYLQKNFNKEILGNLAVLSSYSLEINNYLEQNTKHLFNSLSQNFLGTCVDLNDAKALLEIKYVIKKIANQKNIEISRDVLAKLSNWILEKKPNLKLKLKNAFIYADRGYLFVLKDDLKTFNQKSLLSIGSFDFGPWTVTVKNVDKVSFHSSWKNVFRDEIVIYIPEDKYFISYPEPNKKLKKIWENNKVPSFLRRIFPVVYKDDKMVYDFLSGMKIKLNNNKILQISLKSK